MSAKAERYSQRLLAARWSRKMIGNGITPAAVRPSGLQPPHNCHSTVHPAIHTAVTHTSLAHDPHRQTYTVGKRSPHCVPPSRRHSPPPSLPLTASGPSPPAPLPPPAPPPHRYWRQPPRGKLMQHDTKGPEVGLRPRSAGAMLVRLRRSILRGEPKS